MVVFTIVNSANGIDCVLCRRLRFLLVRLRDGRFNIFFSSQLAPPRTLPERFEFVAMTVFLQKKGSQIKCSLWRKVLRIPMRLTCENCDLIGSWFPSALPVPLQ